MPSKSAQRRKQFSSCDACRRSHVTCDALRFGYHPGKPRWTGSCSRCSLRKHRCTFEWINNVKKKHSSPRQDRASESPTNDLDRGISYESQNHPILVARRGPFDSTTQNIDSTTNQHNNNGANLGLRDRSGMRRSARLGEPGLFVPEPNTTEPFTSQAESAKILLTQWSDRIFHHGFENIFGRLVGRNGCPFVNDPSSDICIPATELFRKLDADMDNKLDRHNLMCTSELPARKQKRDFEINESLSLAVQSFVARWLPLVSQRSHLATKEVEGTIRDSWRTARRDMLKVINRTSYRSVLTLYLFAQTPVPVGVSEDEELDGISGMLCIQTALLQVQKLRERQRSCHFDGPEVSAWADTSASSDLTSSLSQSCLDFESRAYWAAIMWDTSNSLTMNLRTSLTSGMNGACLEPAWRLTRTFLVGSFHSKTEYWHTNGIEISDEIASQIITAAAVCTIYVWKNITSLKEALREGVEEESVLFVWKALLDAIDIFKTSIRPLLNKCERRLHFLDQVNRLSWYEINLQYYLGILVLVNTIEAADRSDLLAQITETRENAERESFNVLKFGTECTYTIYRPGESDAATSFPSKPITASLVAIDPHPHHVVDSVLLMNKVIRRQYRQGKIKHEVQSHLASILLKALGQLPQSSKIVRAALENLQRSLHRDDGVRITDAVGRDS